MSEEGEPEHSLKTFFGSCEETRDLIVEDKKRDWNGKEAGMTLTQDIVRGMTQREVEPQINIKKCGKIGIQTKYIKDKRFSGQARKSQWSFDITRSVEQGTHGKQLSHNNIEEFYCRIIMPNCMYFNM